MNHRIAVETAYGLNRNNDRTREKKSRRMGEDKRIEICLRVQRRSLKSEEQQKKCSSDLEIRKNEMQELDTWHCSVWHPQLVKSICDPAS